jgi:hypothetical protein
VPNAPLAGGKIAAEALSISKNEVRKRFFCKNYVKKLYRWRFFVYLCNAL